MSTDWLLQINYLIRPCKQKNSVALGIWIKLKVIEPFTYKRTIITSYIILQKFGVGVALDRYSIILFFTPKIKKILPRVDADHN